MHQASHFPWPWNLPGSFRDQSERQKEEGALAPWCPGPESPNVASGSRAWGGRAAAAPQEARQMVFPGNCFRHPGSFLPSVSPILTSAHSASSMRPDSGGPGTDAGRILGASVCKIGREAAWPRSLHLDTRDTQRISQSVDH